MTPLEREMKIIELQDYRDRLGMANIANLSYDEQVKARAQYRLNVKEIDRQIRELESYA